MDNNVFSWQQNDYEKLCQVFNTRKKIILIHGKDYESPYHVLSPFYEQLSEQGKIVFGVYSDSAHLTYPFLPFAQATNRVMSKKQRKKTLLPSVFKDLTKSDTIANLVDSIVNESHSSLVLSERENELLIQLEYIAEGYEPVFVFSGYPLFDTNSKNLAILMLSGQLDYDYHFLRNAQFIFLCEDDEAPMVFQHIKNFEHIDIRLSAPKPSDMQEILSEIAPELDLSVTDQNKLFFLSGGRLSVIQILSQYLISKGEISIIDSTQELVKSTLADRILNMGKLGSKLESILEVAAHIGNTFYIPLLKQVTESSDCELVLNKSDQEFLTQCDQNTGKFTYHEIWDFFYSNPEANKKKEIALALERAVYYFNPYDYLTRAHYLELAGSIQDAYELYIMAYNAIFQEGLIPQKDLKDKITELGTQCGLLSYWNSLSQVYATMGVLDFENCLQILEDMDHPSTIRSYLLKEYLTGLCMHRLGDNHGQQQGAIIAMQEAADHAQDIEEGLWCDCNMALMSFLVNESGDINAAKKICKRLSYYYMTKTFAFAQKGLHALERKWSALYSVERAVIKTEASVRYFRNSAYPSQYLMALNNHAANLIVLGNYAEAVGYLNEAFFALQRFRAVHINRMYLLNNICLCSVLSGRLSPSAAYKCLSPIIEREAFGDWKVIFQLNYSIYMALAGEIDRAEESLQELERISLDLCDDYYLFYIYANMASIFYLQGRCADAIEMLKNKCLQAPKLFKATEKMYVEERTKQWIHTMKSIEIRDPKVFDTYLLDKHPEQTQWAFIGRGFLYSDIQFWAEP